MFLDFKPLRGSFVPEAPGSKEDTQIFLVADAEEYEAEIFKDGCSENQLTFVTDASKADDGYVRQGTIDLLVLFSADSEF